MERTRHRKPSVGTSLSATLYTILHYIIFQVSQAAAAKPEWGPRLKENREGKYANDNFGYVPDDDETPKVYPNADIIAAENGRKPKDYPEFHKL